MEGIARAAASRLAEYQRTHPGTEICQVEGNFRTWKPDPGDPFSGEMAYGRTEADLAAKLDGG